MKVNYKVLFSRLHRLAVVVKAAVMKKKKVCSVWVTVTLKLYDHHATPTRYIIGKNKYLSTWCEHSI